MAEINQQWRGLEARCPKDGGGGFRLEQTVRRHKWAWMQQVQEKQGTPGASSPNRWHHEACSGRASSEHQRCRECVV